MPGDTVHRFGDEYLTQRDWGRSAPDLERRVALALGPEPLADARHLLAPIVVPEVSDAPYRANAPDPATAFIIDVSGPTTVPLLSVAETLTPEARAALDFPRAWGRAPGSAAADARWSPLAVSALEALPSGDLPLGGVALVWELSSLVSMGREAVADLESYVQEAARRFAGLGWSAVPRETPQAAVTRAARLNRIKSRFARAVEMRLVPQGRPFPSRQVWRAAYALGLTWGAMDLFHWSDPITGFRWFTLSSLGAPGYFLPERAAEGESAPGIALGFELPTAPAPLETFDRMAVALDYLRHRLGGRPVTSAGAELDVERLDADRESLQEAADEMARSGIAPGSPEAARYF